MIDPINQSGALAGVLHASRAANPLLKRLSILLDYRRKSDLESRKNLGPRAFGRAVASRFGFDGFERNTRARLPQSHLNRVNEGFAHLPT